MEDINKALNKAKIQLMSRPDTSFFTTICFSLNFLWDDSIRTACTNGSYLKFNPEFFKSLSPDERVFLLVHESCHVAYMHMDRVQNRNKDKWNIAADHVINLMLIERGFIMPAGKNAGLADPAYKGMNTEKVYELLPDPTGEDTDRDIVESDLPQEEFERTIEDILVRASIQSKMDEDKAGTIPGDIQLFLNGLLKPKLPWHRILQKQLQAFAKNDYSFKKPNRRLFPKYYLPSLYSENLMNIAIAVDISGSVTDLEFKQIVTEVHSIFRMMKPEKISLIQFDTEIKSVNEIHNLYELMTVQFAGRGGTDIRPVIQWANDNKPQLLLIFTDGGFRHHGETTKVNTIWLIHDNQKFTASYGRVINYEMGKLNNGIR